MRLFLALWWPGLLVLSGGTGALLTTGQVDPRDWAVMALILFGLGGWLSRGDVVRAVLTAGGVLIVQILCWLGAGRAPPGFSVAVLLAVALLAAVGGMAARRWRDGGTGRSQRLPRLWPLAFVMAAMLIWATRPQPMAPSPDRPRLAVLSGLPLFWREGPAGTEARADASIVTLLRQVFTVLPIDSPGDPFLSQIDRLLVAQPRALSPSELVALDAWVRQGGRAVLLADPLLRWPSPLAIGDRRRAPPVTLLGPLLDHWGVAPPGPVEPGERRIFVDNGALLTAMAFSTMASSGRCSAIAQGLAVRCAVGRGVAVVVADADLIDDRLWLADPARPLDPRAWTADTPMILARWLDADPSVGPRHWVVDAAHLRRAILWGLMFGIAWAVLGAALLMARARRSRGPPGLPSSQEDARN